MQTPTTAALLLVLLAAVAAPLSGHAEDCTIHPAGLRCEYQVNPLALEETTPRLGWTVEAAETGARGLRQTAYRIQVASTPEKLAEGAADRWDSGKVESGDSVLIPYAGETLTSRMRCHWRVRVWDAAGNASDWSVPARWTMGLLEEADWSARWIGKDEAEEAAPPIEADWIWYPEGTPQQSAPPDPRYFRRVFTLPEGRPILRAVFAGTADNQMTAWLNGVEVLRAHSYHTAPHKEVTKLLAPGAQNVLAIEAVNVGDAANPAGLIAALHIEFEEGAPLHVATDAGWRASARPAFGWHELPFDDGAWPKAKVLGENGIAPWGPTRRIAERRLPARYLRHEFTLDAPPEQATLYLCGLGFYEAYLNGQRVGDAELAPALTDYRKRAFYCAYDVTDLLKSGGNAVGVALGNGRYYAPRGKEPAPTVTFGYPKVLFQLEIGQENGETDRVVSGSGWKLTDRGPNRNNNVYDGEEYDARMELGAWTQPGHDDTAWEAAALVDPPEGDLEPQAIEPIRVTKTLKPKSRTNPEPGVYILDMGQNMVGWIRFEVEAEAGARIQLRHAETLDGEGNLDVRNMRGAAVTDTYICKGGGVETYAPTFTYHGFRYVEVTGWPGEPALDAFTGEVLHTDVEPVGAFECSHPLLNQIHDNIQWGVRGNLRSIPTDCPQRDERHGWLGDIANEAKAQSYEFLMANFYRKWLDDIRLAQKETGSVPDVAPPYWELYSDNVTWPSTYVIIPEWYYTQYGDKRLIEHHYPHMKSWIDHMSQYIDDKGLMPRDQYGDWCVPPEDPELIHSKDPARKTEPELLGTTYFYHNLKLMESYAKLLGRESEAARFAAQAAKMAAAFEAAFWNEEAGVYGKGTQTGQVLPLYFGMVPEARRERVVNALVESIMEDNGGHLATGLVGGQWLMRTLTDNGHGDVAWTIATQEDYPSWGYMVRNGATTLWELWNGNTADPAMNSHNHLMLTGDLVLWFYEYLAGIRAAKPAFEEVLILPHIIDGLDEVRAHTTTPRGRVAVHWRRAGGGLRVYVETPPNTESVVAVPTLGADRVTVRESGQVVWESGQFSAAVQGISTAWRDGPWIRFQTGSGHYRFEVQP